jgi:cytochrome c
MSLRAMGDRVMSVRVTSAPARPARAKRTRAKSARAKSARMIGVRMLGGFVALGGALLPAGAAQAADPGHGEQVYRRCMACHALAQDRTGPRHCGLLGRRAGTVPGFDYSAAMKRSRIVWTTATLDAFLADPMTVVPGTAMGYAGVKDPVERADLIAYLAQASASAACRKG